MANPTRFRPLSAQVNASGLGQVLAGNLTTTNNTATAVQSVPVPSNASIYISVVMVGRRTDGVNAGDTAIAKLECVYKNVGGVLTQIGADTASLPYASTSINASVASSAINGSQVDLRIAGVVGATIDWQITSGTAQLAF